MNPLTDRSVFTVSQLNQRARQLLEISFASVRVEGEISNLSRPSSGHWYFTLKDSNAQVRCAMFRGRTSLLRFIPKEGDKVEVVAKVSLYENRGDYQLIVDAMKPAGEGALLLAFQQLKEKLASEGLFAEQYKKPLPKSIKRVGVVTSPTGAAIHDILTVLKRRDPRIEVDIYPTMVQGNEATAHIVAAIERANRDHNIDVLIVGRGGGSLEDLWCFNEEAVARAVFASTIPVVSAVGHEVDFSIADFVADLRAATPSAAAELVSQDSSQQALLLKQLQLRFVQALSRQQAAWQQRLTQLQLRLKAPFRHIQQHSQQLDQLEIRLLRAFKQQQQQRGLQLDKSSRTLQAQHPQRQLSRYREQLQQQQSLLVALQKQLLKLLAQKLNPLPQRLQQGQRHQLQLAQDKLARQAQLLSSLSPLNVLARGYSLTRDSQGQVIRQASQLKAGSKIRTLVQQGWFEAQVLTTSDTQAPQQGELL